MKNPSSPKFYTNRALCYLKLRKWQLTISDCQHAIDIDPKNVKAYFFTAQAHLELQCYDEAIANFKQGKRSFSFLHVTQTKQYLQFRNQCFRLYLKGICSQRFRGVLLESILVKT